MSTINVDNINPWTQSQVTIGPLNLTGTEETGTFTANKALNVEINGMACKLLLYCPPPPPTSFMFTVNTAISGSSSNNQFTIPTFLTLDPMLYNYTVTTSEQTLTNQTGDVTLTWATPGTYSVEISGTFPSIYFNNGDKNKILEIQRWGSNKWKYTQSMFYGCSNLDVTATDSPDFSEISSDLYSDKSLSQLFLNCSSLKNLNGSIGNWDVSQIKDFGSMFFGCSQFNVNLNNWNVSNATSLGGMFSQCSIYNQPLNNWDVSNVLNFTSMFNRCYVFNQPIFTVSSGVYFSGMFYNCPFNQDISSWDMSNAWDLSLMFSNDNNLYAGFNQNINGWNVSNVTLFSNMFNGASSFNQPLNNWNINTTGTSYSAGVYMNSMFAGAQIFNQPLNNWNTSNVVDMSSMFGGSQFNQDISMWNTSKVGVGVDPISGEGMAYMFASCPFNYDISNWNVSNVGNMQGMFYFNTSFNKDISNWNVSNVTTFANMFRNASAFNQIVNFDTSGWTGSAWQNGAVEMTEMFMNSGQSTENYTDTIISFAENCFNYGGWIGNNLTSQSNKVFTNIRTSAVFFNAGGARNYLVNTNGWTIDGDTIV